MSKAKYDPILGRLREKDVSSAGDLEARLGLLEARVNEYHYTAISVSPSDPSFTILVGAKANTVLQNKAIASLNKNGKVVSYSQVGGFNGGATLSGKTIQVAGTLSAARNAITIGSEILNVLFRDNSGEGTSQCTMYVKLNVYNNIYYGVGGATFGQSQMTALLSNTKARTVTVNAGSGLYIWYAVPKRLGECKFTVGGFSGGFELMGIQSLTNANGYREDYYLYRSQIAGLGQTTVVIN